MSVGWGGEEIPQIHYSFDSLGNVKMGYRKTSWERKQSGTSGTIKGCTDWNMIALYHLVLRVNTVESSLYTYCLLVSAVIVKL